MFRMNNKLHTTPYLSVILPVYNVEKYLRQALDSILCQANSNIEILIVDDGSTDLSGCISDKYANEYPNVHSFHIPNSGQAVARNYGLEKARGEYIYFMDPDDWVEYGLFEEAINRLIKDNTEIFFMNFSFVAEDGRYIRKSNNIFNSCNGIISAEQCIEEMLLGKVEGFVWQIVFKKSLAVSDKRFVDFRDMKYEDVVWLPEIIHSAKKISISNKYFYNYRQRNNSTAHSVTINNINDRKMSICIVSKFIIRNYPNLVKLIKVWQLRSLIHLYSMIAKANQSNNSDELKTIQKSVKNQICMNHNFFYLSSKNQLRYFLIVLGLFQTVKKIKGMIR